MHIPEARLIKHIQTARCEKATEILLIWRDVEMAERYGYMEFILYSIKGGVVVEGVTKFKYMGRPLDQMDDELMAVRQNVKQARRLWGRLGEMIRREGAEPIVVEILYREVTQVVLLFVSETWLILAAMEIILEGTHTSFLRQITGNWVWWKTDGTWDTPAAEEVQ